MLVRLLIPYYSTYNPIILHIPEITPTSGAKSERFPMRVITIFTSHTNLGFTTDEQWNIFFSVSDKFSWVLKGTDSESGLSFTKLALV